MRLTRIMRGGQLTRLCLVIGLFCGSLLISRLVSATPLISQGFLIHGDIAQGSIVSLQKDSTDYVELTSFKNANNTLGVVIDSAHPQVSISSDQANQVQVATNGIENVLVSDINGNISAGDSITASSIDGVGMKATVNARAVGIAQDDFPNKTAKQQEYTDKAKQKHTVKIGEVPVLVNVSDFFKQPEKTLIPPVLQNLANALAGKKVNPLPILISMGIFIVTLIVVASIIYAMIHSSIISVGRNPMAQAAVYRNVIQLSGLVVVILVVAVAAIYMVLRQF